MSLRRTLRGFRAITLMLGCALVALSPAVAAAAPKAKHAAAKAKPKKATGIKEAKANTKVAKRIVVPTVNADGLGSKVGLGPSMQLAAMDTAIKAAPAFYTGRTTGCVNTTALLTSGTGQVMAGNFRDGEGNCYVWLNVDQSSLLTGSEICKTTLHEMGHLNGLQHSADPNDVMYAPFQSDPIPAPCQA